MHAIGLFAEILREQSTDAVTKPVSDNISRSVFALNRLLNGILDVSRHDAGDAKFNYERVALYDEMFLNLGAEFQSLAEAKGLRFRLVACRSISVITDRVGLERVLRNLVSNAIKYTHIGRVLLGCRRRGQFVRIEVHDTGIGVKDGDTEDIFDEFVQLGNHGRDREQGVGLGLAVVARVAQSLGYTYGVKSKLGIGSCFWIEMPMEDRATVLILEKQEDEIVMGNGKRLVVAVIDDESDICDAYRTLFSGWGYQVVTGESADDIIRSLSGNESGLDAIVSDYRLREKETGIEVITKLRRHFNSDSIPALLSTGDTSPGLIDSLKDRGYQAIAKPVPPARLRAFLVFAGREKMGQLET